MAGPTLAARPARLEALTVRHVMVAATFLGIFAAASGAFLDPDTWWHLRAGEWMIDHGRILTHDPFSWTRLGRPWLDHSWLAQIAMYALERATGFGGLSLAVAGIVTLAFVFVYLQTEGSVYLRTFTVLLAALASGVHWLIRPEVVSLLLTAGFAYILHRFRWTGINRLWLLPPMMVAWVNLHAGFIAGFLLLGGTLAGQIGSRLFGLRDQGTVRGSGVAWLAATGVACGAAALLNPYGARLLVYPFQTASIPALGEFIQEWASPNFHLAATQPFACLLLATFAAVGLSERRIDLTDLVLFAGFAYLALFAARNIALFALIAPPILTRHAAPALAKAAEWRPSLAPILDARSSSSLPTPRLGRLNWSLLAIIVVFVVVRGIIALRVTANELALRNGLPVRAVAAVRETLPQGRIFNPYDWGGYLIWKLYPRDRVYIDGRTDLYGDAFVREYFRLISGQDAWRLRFAEMSIRTVIINSGAPLATSLRNEPGWTQLYRDSIASVFVRE
jgi:hypothetical protein